MARKEAASGIVMEQEIRRASEAVLIGYARDEASHCSVRRSAPKTLDAKPYISSQKKRSLTQIES